MRCKFFFLFIGQKPTRWPANNCLKVMVCSCAMSSNCVWLKCLAANNFLLMRKRHHAFLILLLAITLAWKMAESFASRRYSLKNKLGDVMIKQLLNSAMAKYRDLSVSDRSIIICLSLRLVQIIDLLGTDESRYFARWEDTIRYITQSVYQRCTCDFIPWSTYWFKRHILTRWKDASILLSSREMNEILKNTHVFVDVLCMSRCDAVRQWDEGAFQKAYKWANYFEEVTETKFSRAFLWIFLDLHCIGRGSYILYRA